MSLNESIVEDAALEWFGELGYTVGHRPHLAPGEPAAARDSFGEVVLVERLRAALLCLNGAIPEDAREEALRKVLQVGTPSLAQISRALHKMLENFWLSQKMMMLLYDVETHTVNYHLKKVFDNSELEAGSVIRNFRITDADGKTHDKVSLAIPEDVSATHKESLSVQNISKDIYAEGELTAGATIRKFQIVRAEGKREVAREIEHYNFAASTD